MPSKTSAKKACRFCDALSTLNDSRFIAESPEGVLTLGGNLVPDDQLEQLVGESKAFKQTILYKILTETLRAHGIHQGLTKATDYDQVLWGKSLLYAADINGNTIKAIEQEHNRRKKVAPKP